MARNTLPTADPVSTADPPRSLRCNETPRFCQSWTIPGGTEPRDAGVSDDLDDFETCGLAVRSKLNLLAFEGYALTGLFFGTDADVDDGFHAFSWVLARYRGIRLLMGEVCQL